MDDEADALTARSGSRNLLPLPGAPKMSETTPMGSQGSLYDSAGKKACTESRSSDQRIGILPRFGPLGSVKPYSCFVYWMCMCPVTRSTRPGKVHE